MKFLAAIFFISILAYIHPVFAQVAADQLHEVNGFMCLKSTNDPYTGASFENYPEGQKGKEGKYNNGKQEGTWTWYYKDGQKKRESLYKNSKKNGKTLYWYKSGQKQSEANYINDEISGKASWWYESGKKKKVAIYRDGLFIGGIEWDELGNVTKNSMPKDQTY